MYNIGVALWQNKANPLIGNCQKGSEMIGRLIKYLIILAVLGAIGIAGYALFFDLPPPTTEIIIPVTLNGV